MCKEIKLLNDNDNKDWSDLEWIEEFNDFLQGTLPDGITMSESRKPKLTPEQSFAVIWYLQEHFCLLPDHIEKCSNCDKVYDSYETGIYSEKESKFFCQSCEHLTED